MAEGMDKVKIGQLIWTNKKVHPVISLSIKFTQISGKPPTTLIKKMFDHRISTKNNHFLNRLQQIHPFITHLY